MKLSFSLWSIACMLLMLRAEAQNLVPNPSFENLLACPNGTFTGIPFPSEGSLFALNWYRPTAGSSDYYNTCSSDPNFSVPENMFGHQVPRTGNGYVGGLVEQMGNEFLETQLSAPLVAGHRYHVSYWINTANISAGACDRFSAYFSPTVIELPNVVMPSGLIPQLNSPVGQIFPDTAGWMPLAGSFVAAGNESWMCMGVFSTWDSLAILPFVEDGGFGIGPLYYYFDDVCVLDMDGLPENAIVKDTSLCPLEAISLEGRSGMHQYLWNDGSTGNIKPVTAGGTYWVKSVDAGSCRLYVDTFHVAGGETRLPLDIGRDTALCKGASITLDAHRQAFSDYHWNTGEETAAITVRAPGTYSVTAKNGCTIGSDTIRITDAGTTCGQCLFMPNAFSPNADGLNDHIQVKSRCPLSSYHISIYNRYGQQVFLSGNLLTEWDGRYKGAPCDPGTYYYYVEAYTEATPSVRLELRGDITLVR